jgi:hypothetical protein
MSRKTNFRTSGLLALVVLILFGSGTLQAQLSTASLSGTVVDPSGAGIPSATITLESTLQKYAREAVTGSEGSYVMPAIPPGKYKLTVKASGFQPETLAEFSLSSGQATTIDVAMHLAKAGESVTVIAAPPLLQTTTATVGQAIDRAEITQLPISQRNVTNLTLLVPGVGARNAPDGGTPQTMYAGGSNPSFYGQRQRSNNWTLDGVPVNEPMQNGVVLMPPVDAVSEMKIESGMASGAYGHAAGANVNVVSRSGGNAYHGDAWEYLQNSSLDARSFFAPFIAKYRRNTFGVAAGGPLLIPGLLSKQKAWYLYGYYEGLRLRQSGQTSSLFPTTEQLNGNFAAEQSIYQNPRVTPAIYNPYSTVPGEGGTSVRQPFPNNQIPANLLDTSAETLAKLFYAKPNIPYGQVAGANFFTTGPIKTDGNQWSARVDHQFGSKHGFFSRYSEFRNIDSNAVRPNLPSNQYRRNTQAVLSDTITLSPTFVVTGRFGLTRLMWDSLGAANFTIAKAAGTLETWPKMQGLEIIPPITIPGYAGMAQGDSIYGPQLQLSWIADATKLAGHHTIEFGGSVIRTGFKVDNQTGTSVTYATAQTANFGAGGGDAMASFVLGLPLNAARLIGTSQGDMIGNAWSLYFQDNWKVTPKLSLNFGVRYDYVSPMVNHNGSGTFEFETGKYLFTKTNPVTGEAPNAPPGLLQPDRTNFAPRVGVAYQLGRKTVIRASYGLFYDSFGVNYAQTQQGNRGNWPFAFPQTASSLNSGLPDAIFPNVFPGPAQGSTVPLGCQQCLNAFPATSRTPYVHEYTASIQRQLTTSIVLEGVYFGSRGEKLSGQIIDNSANPPGPGPVSARQKYPQFPPYVNNGYNGYRSWYNAMSVKLEKRMSQNLTFLASYTLSRNLDEVDSLVNSGSPFETPTRYSLDRLKGRAGFDTPQRFVASYVYKLPVNLSNKIANGILGDWNVSGVLSFDSGFPFSVVLPGDNENVGSLGGRVSQYPNVTGDPHLSNPTLPRWFNTGAFSMPPIYTSGNAKRNILRQDGYADWDCGIQKQFALKEGRFLELRAEAINALNITVFGQPNSQFGTPTFGQVTGVRQSGRTITVGARFHF